MKLALTTCIQLMNKSANIQKL